jgi:hypothetical protein
VFRFRAARAVMALSVMAAIAAGCSDSDPGAETPVLEAPGTVLTTVKPVRKDVVNSISLTGKVTIDPVFGIVAPIGGEVRYVERRPNTVPVDQATWVASVWKRGVPSRVEIPKGSMLAGRLMADHATVTAGMPIISAKHAGYGIVAEIDSAQAYRLSGRAQSVRGQIKNGPGPFACKPLGTVAALPEGTVPEPPQPTDQPAPDAQQSGPPVPEQPGAAEEPQQQPGSESTGLRLVCTAPKDIKLINGASVTLDVVTGKAAKALVLPVEAVAGTQGKGKVDLVGADQQRTTVDVTLGLTDGRFVEIRAGLNGSETVAVPGPDLPGGEAPADPGAGPGVQVGPGG